MENINELNKEKQEYVKEKQIIKQELNKKEQELTNNKIEINNLKIQKKLLEKELDDIKKEKVKRSRIIETPSTLPKMLQEETKKDLNIPSKMLQEETKKDLNIPPKMLQEETKRYVRKRDNKSRTFAPPDNATGPSPLECINESLSR